MMRVATAACLVGFGSAILLPAAAQSATVRSGDKAVQAPLPVASQPAATDLSAERRRPRARVRIYQQGWPDDVYPRYDPGPNALRVCNATYVQEYRPSGTVIVPHLSCFWRRG
jgi:hypothetical protein